MRQAGSKPGHANMKGENPMSYEDLFSRYGSPRDEGEINVRAWFQRPEKLRTGADIKTADERAARVIAECKAVIETMNELRARLTIRYNALETLPYHIRVTLKRDPGYSSGIEYWVIRERVLEDGTEIYEYQHRYAGKERRQAIKDYEAMLKQFPGCEAVKDIEKKQWER